MAVTSGFFNSQGNDRLYDADQVSEIFNGIIEDGVFASIGTAFGVRATTGNVLNVGIGRGWFNSRWIYNDSILPITAEDSEVLLDRIDAVVIEIDNSLSVRAGDIKMVKGTPSSSPQNPTMVSTEYVHQYPLCYIMRKAGSTSITQSQITNMIGTSSCPYVTGLLQVQNIDNIVAQWQAEWAEFFDNISTSMENSEDTFNIQFQTWFENLQDMLDENQAANLQHQIDDIKRCVQVTLYADNWSDTFPFTNEVHVVNFEEADTPALTMVIDADATEDEVKQYRKNFALIYRGEVTATTAKFYALKKPAIDMRIGLSGGSGAGTQSYSESGGGGDFDATGYAYVDDDTTGPTEGEPVLDADKLGGNLPAFYAAAKQVSEAFSEESSYVVGDYCIYENSLYKFTAAKDPGEWDGTKVTVTSVDAEIQAVKSDLDTLNSGLFTVTIEADDTMPLAANTSSDWLSLPISKSGYKLLGVIGFSVGTNTGIFFNQIYPENNSIAYALRNTSSQQANCTPKFWCLWLKTIA